jgi:hypothetical protein
MLVVHPQDATDEFTLYIKAISILGKVKVFNGRFRSKYGGADFPGTDVQDVDVRDTAEFQTLDTLIKTFSNTFPQSYKEAVPTAGSINPTLYSAHIIPYT